MKKDKKKHKKNSFKLWKIITIVLVVLVLLLSLFFFLNAEDEESKLTLLEKQWIENNKTTLIDIDIPNNLSFISENGSGVLFDFLTKLETTGLTFNKKSYDYPSTINENTNLSILVLKNTDKLTNKDILIMEDSYVLVGKNEGFIVAFENLNSPVVGILDNDKDINLTNYNSSTQVKTYETISALISALKNGDVNYIVGPRYVIFDEILEEELYIKYDFNNLSNKIVLRLSNIEKLNDILIKYLEDWKAISYESSYEKNLMNLYINNKLITDVDKSNLSSRTFTYGFVNNSSYNIYQNGKLYGLAGEYINVISSMANIEFEFIEYETEEKLTNAIKQGVVDIAFINFDYTNESGYKTISAFDSKLVALSKNNQIITDKTGLVNRDVVLYQNTNLYNYLNDNYNVLIKQIDNLNTKIDNDSILVLDEYDYIANKDALSSYNLLFMDNYNNSSYYYVQNSDNVLYRLINFVLNNTDYYDIKNRSINSYYSTLSSESNFKSIYIIILCIILVPIFILFFAVVLSKSKTNFKKAKKENVLKYNDMLTSLKNRNYLNANINKWDDTKIYPKSIIVIDLNNLKYINDNYGYNEGDLLIKKAAAILINTQLERSEIIRTDGNEFLIYLIGYTKTQINAYISKLEKELEKLPYNFGAAVGYSIIEDEMNTIEDAINDATIEMKTNKEMNYK